MQGRGTNFYRKSYIESNLKEKILTKEERLNGQRVHTLLDQVFRQ